MEAVEAARALLPWWVTWGPVLFFLPLSFVLAGIGAVVTALVAGLPGPVRDPDLEHWTVRARRTWPTRVALIVAIVCLPGFFMVAALGFAGELCPLGLAGQSGVAAILAATAVFVVRARVEDAIRGHRLSLFRHLTGGVALLLCFLPHVIVVAATAPLYGPAIDWRFFAVLAATAALMPFASSGGLGLARLLRLARPAPEWLEELVRRVAAAEGVETRPTLVLAWNMANALAYPGARRLAFTEPALEVLGEEQIAAVTAHEVGHLTESKGVLVGRTATTLLLLPLGMAIPLSSGGQAWIYGVVGLVSLLAFALSRSLFQRMETRADEVATRHEHGSGDHARALERLHEASMMPAVLGTRHKSHPDLYDRLLACGVEPDYPRPAAPKPRRAGRAALVGLLAVIACIAPIRLDLLLRETFAEDRRDLEVVMALGGAWPHSLDALAVMLTDSGQLDEAEPVAEAAADLAEWSATYPALLAEIRAERGRCDGAVLAFAEAERRLAGDPQARADVDEARVVLSTSCPGRVPSSPNLLSDTSLH